MAKPGLNVGYSSWTFLTSAFSCSLISLQIKYKYMYAIIPGFDISSYPFYVPQLCQHYSLLESVITMKSVDICILLIFWYVSIEKQTQQSILSWTKELVPGRSTFQSFSAQRGLRQRHDILTGNGPVGLTEYDYVCCWLTNWILLPVSCHICPIVHLNPYKWP